MIFDPRTHLVLIERNGSWNDKTSELRSFTPGGPGYLVGFVGGPKVYPFATPRIRVLSAGERETVGPTARVAAAGRAQRNVSEIIRFDDGRQIPWLRLFFRDGSFRSHPADEVSVEPNALDRPAAAAVLDYWRAIVRLPQRGAEGSDPLAFSYERLEHVEPESVLGMILSGAEPGAGALDLTPIYPFASNISQRRAVTAALQNTVSIIEGPPGTGKTQTILNLLATLVAAPGTTVGVVSFNNSAVDNVREKLEREGLGHITAALGNKERQLSFFAGQADRNAIVGSQSPPAEVFDARSVRQRLDGIEERLEELQRSERRLAEVLAELRALQLERAHLVSQHPPATVSLWDETKPSSATVSAFLAETQVAVERGGRVSWLSRLVWRIRFGRLGALPIDDSNVALRLQRLFLDRRSDEVQRERARLESLLENADLHRLLAEQKKLSMSVLKASLHGRYASTSRREWQPADVKRDLPAFMADYPILTSTCHSLRSNIGARTLLDCVIIDEASQLDVVTAALVLASAKRVVIVGDDKQLRPIVRSLPETLLAPEPWADYTRHSVLSAVVARFGDAVPRTMLREHYRCHPAIIGFCNEQFYDGKLIPLTSAAPGVKPLTLVRTALGQHMRSHTGGGRTNQREIDVIEQEVIPRELAGFSYGDIGITTPYRRQVTALGRAVAPEVMTDTVHKFQGREMRAIVMSTVIDDTAAGRRGVTFVDDPRMVNVAVSRAVERFVLVTDNRMLPTSTNLRQLIGYIRYQNPEAIRDESALVSVFDLLYRDYSERLRPLASRVRNRTGHLSEDIVWAVLDSLFAEGEFAHLRVTTQVLLINLVPSATRLDPEQAWFVARRASVDFLVYDAVTRSPVLVIEVDGFRFHEDSPRQLQRDALKDEILARIGLPLLRLPTTGSGEVERIRDVLRALH